MDQLSPASYFNAGDVVPASAYYVMLWPTQYGFDAHGDAWLTEGSLFPPFGECMFVLAEECAGRAS